MNDIKRIVGINLAIFFFYTVIGVLSEGLLGFPLLIGLILQFLFNVFASIYRFARKDSKKGQAHILSILITLAIGVPLCFSL